MGRTTKTATSAAMILTGLLNPGLVNAQQATPVVSGTTREEVTPPPLIEAAPKPRLQIDGDIERAPCPLADPAYANLKLTINGATFNNLQGVDPKELRSAYEEFLGQSRPVSTICTIRDAAATILRRKGYLAAVQVPTQQIENGNVRFEVLYARIVAVRVRGAAGRSESLIAGYLQKLTQDPVFNRNTAERYLLLARDLPGYDVRLELKSAGGKPGDLVGEVTVLRTPFEVDFNVQNYASRETGRLGGQLRAQIYGLTGFGDRTTFALYSTADFKEQQIIQVGHDFRVGPEGLTFGGRFSYAWTTPGLQANSQPIKARTLFASLEAGYPFLRSQYANIRGAGGLDFVDQTVRFSGTEITRDRLRVGYVRIDADTIDTRGGLTPRYRLAGSLEFRKGLTILGASDTLPAGIAPPSRRDGKATGAVVRFQGVAESTPIPNITFSIAPRAQYGFNPLLSFEEFSAGTYTIGRGYDPGTILGDSGVGFSAEIRINRVGPMKNSNLAVQPFIFVDSAWVWNKGATGDPQRLTSIGGGVRASLAGRARLDLTLAIPTAAAGLQTQRGDTRLLLSFTTKLWPWGNR
ncbi:MAG: ShlB/FhaC/HecB family hemolysin secretion/activation protein [Sphingomonas sp.]